MLQHPWQIKLHDFFAQRETQQSYVHHGRERIGCRQTSLAKQKNQHKRQHRVQRKTKNADLHRRRCVAQCIECSGHNVDHRKRHQTRRQIIQRQRSAIRRRSIEPASLKK